MLMLVFNVVGLYLAFDTSLPEATLPNHASFKSFMFQLCYMLDVLHMWQDLIGQPAKMSVIGVFLGGIHLMILISTPFFKRPHSMWLN